MSSLLDDQTLLVPVIDDHLATYRDHNKFGIIFKLNTVMHTVTQNKHFVENTLWQLYMPVRRFQKLPNCTDILLSISRQKCYFQNYRHQTNRTIIWNECSQQTTTNITEEYICMVTLEKIPHDLCCQSHVLSYHHDQLKHTKEYNMYSKQQFLVYQSAL